MPITRETVLITGGRGYIATKLALLLRDSDCHVIRLSRDARAFPHIPAGKASFEEGTANICDPLDLATYLPRASVVFHLAAQTSVYLAEQHPIEDLHANVLPMLSLLEHCRSSDRKPVVVFAGTATQVGLATNMPVGDDIPDRPVTIYDLHKIAAESYLTQYVNAGFVAGGTLRLANVYGPGPASSSADRGVLNAFVRRALAGESLTVYGKGDCLRDYVFVEDVARAFLAAAANGHALGGGHFVIGSGQGHSIAEMAHTVADRVESRTGRRVPVVHVEAPPSLSPIERRNFVADSSRFSARTGWRPRVDLVTGIDSTIDFFGQTDMPQHRSL